MNINTDVLNQIIEHFYHKNGILITRKIFGCVNKYCRKIISDMNMIDIRKESFFSVGIETEQEILSITMNVLCLENFDFKKFSFILFKVYFYYKEDEYLFYEENIKSHEYEKYDYEEDIIFSFHVSFYYLNREDMSKLKKCDILENRIIRVISSNIDKMGELESTTRVDEIQIYERNYHRSKILLRLNDLTVCYV